MHVREDFCFVGSWSLSDLCEIVCDPKSSNRDMRFMHAWNLERGW